MTSTSLQTASLARRERQKADTRQAILDAARELFVSDGIAATTMRAIALKIGYTPTAIYHHFRDKEALIDELCALDFQALGQAMHKIGRIEDPVERLRRMGMAYADFGLSNPSHYRFMFMTEQQQSMSKTANWENLPEHQAYNFLLETVKEGIHDNRFRPELNDPHQFAQMMWGGIHGVLSLWLNHCNDEFITWRPPAETIRSSIDVLMRGSLRAT